MKKSVLDSIQLVESDDEEKKKEPQTEIKGPTEFVYTTPDEDFDQFYDIPWKLGNRETLRESVMLHNTRIGSIL